MGRPWVALEASWAALRRSWGSVVENIKSGRDAVNFHCRVNKDK